MYVLLFIIKRVLAAIAIIAGLTLVLFILQSVSKTNPVHAMLGAGATQSAIAAEKIKLGLDKPLIIQYLSYLHGIVTGNLGMSYRTRRPVASDLATYLPATLELATYALLLAMFLGTILGILSAGKFKGASLVKAILVSGASIPQFLLAIAGLLFLYGKLKLLPATGRIGIANPPTGPTGFYTIDGILNGRLGVTLDAFKYLALPCLSVAIGPAVSIGRVLRGSLLETMGSDFVKTANSKGISRTRVILVHALRNSIGPALSMTGLQAGLMFAGVVVIEDVFAWPGIGYYTAQSIPSGDFPAIAGVTLVLGVGYVIINAAVDIAQLLADPRLRRMEMAGPHKRKSRPQIASNS